MRATSWSAGSTSKSTSRKHCRLVRITIEEDCANSRNHDVDVEPERPAVDIFLVQLDPALGAIDGPDFSTQALYLCKAGDAGTNAMPARISANGILVVAIAHTHLERVRARADQRHVALHDVQQLGQLVDA